MPRKYDYLTKSKIQSGLQCHKKLWFEIHEPIKKKERKATIEIGNRFGAQVIKNYSKNNKKILDLTNEFANVINRTKDAINSKDINIIFEGAFEYLNTQVRVDVLIRKKNGWELLEAKSSTKVKDEHISDVSIQSFIVRTCLKELGYELIGIKLIHVNGDFILQKKDDYDGLINDENDITQKVKEEDVIKYIQELKPLSIKNSLTPNIKMGDHCNKPYSCDFQFRCSSLLPKSNITPYTIIPYIINDKNLKNYMEKEKTIDLQKVPKEYLKKKRKGYAENFPKIIQDSHKNNKSWISKDLKNIFKKFSFPYYFIDFETAMQGVPIIIGTKPYHPPLPFQWSLHKWESLNQEVSTGKSFLKFNDQDIERQFIVSLLDAAGKEGTIFAHSDYEISVLNQLKKKENCKDLIKDIDNLIKRIENSLTLSRENFYSPLMNGSWSIKSIIKAVPGCDISYDQEDGLAGGSDAGLSWLICTDPKTIKSEIEKQIKLLIDYCAKDTLALYYFIKYLMQISRV
tara:strand:+ start:543 stop:2084 length:1542 start_codon:yes stop_codon:yes gene_type:complete